MKNIKVEIQNQWKDWNVKPNSSLKDQNQSSFQCDSTGPLQEVHYPINTSSKEKELENTKERSQGNFPYLKDTHFLGEGFHIVTSTIIENYVHTLVYHFDIQNYEDNMQFIVLVENLLS